MEAVLIPLVFFGFLTVWIYLRHQRYMVELKLRGGVMGDSTVLKELQDLKQQMAELRDTTTRYDMSFDAALQRMESRMGMVEQRLTSVERGSQSVSVEQG